MYFHECKGLHNFNYDAKICGLCDATWLESYGKLYPAEIPIGCSIFVCNFVGRVFFSRSSWRECSFIRRTRQRPMVQIEKSQDYINLRHDIFSDPVRTLSISKTLPVLSHHTT